MYTEKELEDAENSGYTICVYILEVENEIVFCSCTPEECDECAMDI